MSDFTDFLDSETMWISHHSSSSSRLPARLALDVRETCLAPAVPITVSSRLVPQPPVETEFQLSLGSGMVEGWRESWPSLLSSVGDIMRVNLRPQLREAAFEQVILALQKRVQQLEAERPMAVAIQTFGTEPFRVLHPIFVVIKPSDGEYIATFFDANVNASGDNEVEAVENLKGVILDTFENLAELEKQDNLEREAKRQLAVLREFIKPRTSK